MPFLILLYICTFLNNKKCFENLDTNVSAVSYIQIIDITTSVFLFWPLRLGGKNNLSFLLTVKLFLVVYLHVWLLYELFIGQRQKNFLLLRIIHSVGICIVWDVSLNIILD